MAKTAAAGMEFEGKITRAVCLSRQRDAKIGVREHRRVRCGHQPRQRRKKRRRFSFSSSSGGQLQACRSRERGEGESLRSAGAQGPQPTPLSISTCYISSIALIRNSELFTATARPYPQLCEAGLSARSRAQGARATGRGCMTCMTRQGRLLWSRSRWLLVCVAGN